MVKRPPLLFLLVGNGDRYGNAVGVFRLGHLQKTVIVFCDALDDLQADAVVMEAISGGGLLMALVSAVGAGEDEEGPLCVHVQLDPAMAGNAGGRIDGIVQQVHDQRLFSNSFAYP